MLAKDTQQQRQEMGEKAEEKQRDERLSSERVRGPREESAKRLDEKIERTEDGVRVPWHAE